MSRSTRWMAALSIATLASVAGAAAYAPLATFFQSAPAGVNVPVVHVTLPPVVWQPGQAIPPLLANTNGFVPGLDEMLNGNLVIENERSMRFVWARLFPSVPYDGSLFDFQNTFVVLMGGGSMDMGTFGISSVETVDAEYAAGFPFQGNEIERFLSVTATTVIPGQPNPFPPPPTYRIDAVKIPLAAIDDVVFHRTVIGLP